MNSLTVLVPARGPIRVQAWNTSSTSVGVEWEELDWEYRNGLILYFTVYYRFVTMKFNICSYQAIIGVRLVLDV